MLSWFSERALQAFSPLLWIYKNEKKQSGCAEFLQGVNVVNGLSDEHYYRRESFDCS